MYTNEFKSCLKSVKIPAVVPCFVVVIRGCVVIGRFKNHSGDEQTKVVVVIVAVVVVAVVLVVVVVVVVAAIVAAMKAKYLIAYFIRVCLSVCLWSCNGLVESGAHPQVVTRQAMYLYI